MNAYIHDGQLLKVVAPYEVSGGDAVCLGALFGVAKTWAAAGDVVEIFTWGVFDLRKPADEVWDVGQRIHWDERDRCFTHKADGNAWIGYVIEPCSGKAQEFGRVKLVGVAT